MLLPSTALTFTKKKQTTKNQQKPHVFTRFLHFRVCAHASKIIGKLLRTPFSSESRHREFSKDYLFELQYAKMVPEVFVITSGSLLGLLRDPPGRKLDPLGAPLGPPWELRGRSWALLARSWRRFFVQILETSSAGPDFLRFGLRLGTKTSEILTKTCEIMAKT